MLVIESNNQLWKEILELRFDYILDKINKIGIKYLTDNERLYLAKQSGKLFCLMKPKGCNLLYRLNRSDLKSQNLHFHGACQYRLLL